MEEGHLQDRRHGHSGFKRKTSFQDLVELHPTIDYENPLIPPNQPKVHPPVIRSLCTTYGILFIFWILVLICGEYLIFHYTISSCRYPQLSQPSPDDIHLALIGDPQLTDRYSYSWLTSSGFIIPKVVEYYSDIYMRKNFQLLQLYHKPTAIFLMGDLFDSAKVLSEKEYKAEYKRFQWIFQSPFGQKEITPKFNLSGNHDIGYDISPEHQFQLAERFKQYFGPLNYEVTINGVSLVVISATTTDAATSNVELFQETDQFINSLDVSHSNGLPRVLFHHIPLWRPNGTDCGELRSRNRYMKDRVGYSYRNMLDKSITEKILRIIKPFITFSGDDHDYCKVKHTPTTTEYTVGTFSWLQGNPYPSIALVTIKGNPKKLPANIFQPEAEVSVCFLPNQKRIYLFYFLLMILSLIVLVIDPLNPDRRTRSVLVLSKYSEMLRLLVFRVRTALQKVLLYVGYLVLIYFFLLWLSS